MKITIMSSYLSGGGLERVVCNLANYLYLNGHDVTITTITDRKNDYNLNEKIKVVSFDSKVKLKFLRKIFKYIKLRKFLNRDKSDVTLCMLPLNIIWYLKYSKNKKGIFLFSERADPYNYSRKYKKLLLKAANKCDGIVFQTEGAKQFYGVDGEKKGIIIPNAINLEFIDSALTVEKQKIIISAGRMEKQKNFSLLIKAFDKFSLLFPEYKLCIFGNGDEKENIKNEASNCINSNKIEINDFSNNLKEEMLSAEIFVLPSNFEGMPNVLMEAMSLGLACISTDCPPGGPAYLIKNNENGILIPVGDESALLSALKDLAENRDFTEKLGIEAKKISFKLAPEIIYKKWNDFIIESVEKNARK